MKITFHGAARTVTGSKHLISLISGKNILITLMMISLKDSMILITQPQNITPLLYKVVLLIMN